MEGILWGGMALMAAALYGLALWGRIGSRAQNCDRHTASPEHCPGVSVIIPLSGSDPLMEVCLELVLSQSYPDYEVLLVTRSPDEDAATLARRLTARHPAGVSPLVRHVVAGPASSCGQKNRNLLAGIDAASDDREIFVFLDAARQVPPCWLRHLTGPVAQGEAAVTTGYHHILPGDRRLASLGRAVTVLILDRLQGIGPLTQPWGGNTAISKKAFEEFDVRAAWERNVVDDVALETILRRRGKKARFVPEAQLSTPLVNETYGGLCQWLTRQLLYLKFCLPGTWAAAGLLVYLSASLPAMAILRLAAAVSGMLPPSAVLPDTVLLACLLGTAFALRSSHPSPGPSFRWLAASFVAVFVAAFCHMKTLVANKILWRGILYKVSAGGCVADIEVQRE